MTNTELTLNQLQAVAGGAAFMRIGGIRGEYRQVSQSKSTPGGSTSPKNNNTVSEGPGGMTFRTAGNFAGAYSNSISGFRECSAL